MLAETKDFLCKTRCALEPEKGAHTVMADFGQTDFGQPFLLPSLASPILASVSVFVVWPTLAKTDFGQTDFGQTDFDFFLSVFWFHGFRVGVSKFSFGHVRCPRDRPSLDRPSPGPPKISLFFPSPAAKFVVFFPLGVFSLHFGGVFEDRAGP